MKLSDQERMQGIVVATCKCCGNVFKTHEEANACGYSLNPWFGCRDCQGVVPKQRLVDAQKAGLRRFK